MKRLPGTPLALLLIFFVSLAAPFAAADAAEFMTLVEEDSASLAGRFERAESKEGQKTLAIVRLEAAFLAADPDSLAIPLPGGRVLTAFRSATRQEALGGFTWTGELQQEVSAAAPLAAGTVSFYLAGGRLFGTLRTEDGGYFEIVPDGEQHRLVSFASAAGDPCGIGAHVTDKAAPGEVATLLAGVTETDCSTPMSNTTITVLVLYPRSLAGSAAAVDTYATSRITEANNLFSGSDVKIVYQLVPGGGGVMITGEQPPGPRNSANPNDADATEPVLDWLNGQFDTPGVDTEVEILRNYYGADMVSVVIPSHPEVNCGIANLPRVSGGTEVIHGTSTPFGDKAFSVVELNCGNADYTFAHELGHNYGMRHDNDSTPPANAVYPWAFDHLLRNPSAPTVPVAASVMGCFTGGPNACGRIARFSHPDLPYLFSGVGMETGVHSGEVGLPGMPKAAHNACVGNLRAGLVAGYESAPPTTPPTLTITSPSDGSSQSSTSLTLTATATDAQDGSRTAFVQWKSDRQGSLGTGSPLGITLTHYGWHLITATVSDTSGTKIQKSVRLLVTETTAPQSYIDLPAHNQQITGNYLVSGWAIDQSGVASASFLVDGSPVTLTGLTVRGNRADVCAAFPSLNDPNCPNVGVNGYLNTAGMTNGTHTLRMTVTDIHGNSVNYDRTFRTQNTATVYLNPIADAWVSEAAPTTNYGTDTQLQMRATGSSLARHAYLKFQLSGAPRPIATAVLEVRTSPTAWDVINIYRLATTSWSESTVNWNNGPLDPLGYLQLGAQPANSFVQLDVSTLFAGSGNGLFTLGLVTSDNPNHFFYSREDFSRQPTLIVTY